MSKNVESAIIGVSNNIACMITANQKRVPEARKMKPQGATRVHYKVKIVHILYLMAISNPQLAIVDGNSNSLSTKKKEASSSKSLIKEKRQASKGDNNQMSLKSKL